MLYSEYLLPDGHIEEKDPQDTIQNGTYNPSCPDFTFVAGLPVQEVHRRAKNAAGMLCRAGKALAAWLVEIDDRKLYQCYSCSSVYHYAARHLGLAGHTVAEYLRTARKLSSLPQLAAAYEKGELSSTHIRELTRVATPVTEKPWLDMARGRTTREIEKMVAFTPPGGLPPGPLLSPVQAKPDAALPVESQRFHEKLFFELEAEEITLLEAAFAKARRAAEKKDRKSLLLHMARYYLDSTGESGSVPPSGGMGHTGEEKWTRPRPAASPCRVVLHHHLPAGLSWYESDKGERPMPSHTLEKALCDTQVCLADEFPSPTSPETGVTDAALGNATPGSATSEDPAGQDISQPLERIKVLYNSMKQLARSRKDSKSMQNRARRSLSPQLRRKVLERDGHCCNAPGCGSRYFIEVHHLDPVALGGKNDKRRLISLCSNCHDLVHRGLLRLPVDEAEHS